MNISHAVQGDEMNISNQLLKHYINGILFCAFKYFSARDLHVPAKKFMIRTHY